MERSLGPKPSKPKWLSPWIERIREAVSKWVKNAFNAAEGPASEFRRGQRVFVGSTVTVLLLLFEAFCWHNPGFVAIILTTDTHSRGSEWRPRRCLFLASYRGVPCLPRYFARRHLPTCVTRQNRNAKTLTENTYLFLATVSLYSIVTVGADQNISAKQFYANQLEGIRGFDTTIEDIRSALCGEPSPKLRCLILPVAVCHWVEAAKSIVDRPLNVDFNPIRLKEGERIDNLVKLERVPPPRI